MGTQNPMFCIQKGGFISDIIHYYYSISFPEVLSCNGSGKHDIRMTYLTLIDMKGDMIRNYDTYIVLVLLYPNIEDKQKSGQLANYDFENPRQLLRWKLQVR